MTEISDVSASLERDLELKLLNIYHLKGVKLSALQNEERLAILGRSPKGFLGIILSIDFLYHY